MKGNKSGQKENSRLIEHKPYSSTGILLIYHFVLRFTKNVLSLRNTVTYWLMWLFVTRVRQPCSYSLKVQHPVTTTFAHAPMFDCCSLQYVFLRIRLQSNDNSTCDEFTGNKQLTCPYPKGKKKFHISSTRNLQQLIFSN